jgi:hypothetical protein
MEHVMTAQVWTYDPLPPDGQWTVAKHRPCAYIAGPMRGRTAFNFPLFKTATLHLRQHLGWDVISPAEMDLDLGFDPATRLFTHTDWEKAMRRDIEVLLKPQVDRIVFLPDWEDSRGARIERTVGEAIGLEMWYYLPASTPEITMIPPDNYGSREGCLI